MRKGLVYESLLAILYREYLNLLVKIRKNVLIAPLEDVHFLLL